MEKKLVSWEIQYIKYFLLTYGLWIKEIIVFFSISEIKYVQLKQPLKGNLLKYAISTA